MNDVLLLMESVAADAAGAKMKWLMTMQTLWE